MSNSWLCGAVRLAVLLARKHEPRKRDLPGWPKLQARTTPARSTHLSHGEVEQSKAFAACRRQQPPQLPAHRKVTNNPRHSQPVGSNNPRHSQPVGSNNPRHSQPLPKQPASRERWPMPCRCCSHGRAQPLFPRGHGRRLREGSTPQEAQAHSARRAGLCAGGRPRRHGGPRGPISPASSRR